MLAVFVGLHNPAPAFAYCRSMTIKDKTGTPPSFGDDGTSSVCPGSGVPLFWRSRCVGYSISRKASKYVSFDDTSRIVADAFRKWTQSACLSDDPSNSRVSIDARDLGPSDCTAKGYNATGPNQSLIVFRDDNWVRDPGSDSTLAGSNTIALTSVFYSTATGEIYDADMEINSHDHGFTVNSTFQNDAQYDLPSVITHEVGHFLGLDHSPLKASTMFFTYDTYETTKQFLKTDDVQGLCSIYHPDGNRATGTDGATPVPAGPCDPTPRHGLDNTCAATTCAISTPTPGPRETGAWVLACAALGLVVRARRR